MNRRDWLWQAGGGLGGIALVQLLGETGLLAEQPRADFNGGLHHPAKVKRVIQVFLNGGVSQMDTFEYKPALWKYAGQPIPPPRNTVGEIATFAAAPNRVIAPFWQFNQHGESGRWMSDLLPHLATCADDLAFLHGVKVDITTMAPRSTTR